MEFVSKSTQETAEIAANFTEATLAKNNFPKDKATVIGLYGELGSGKTTFMKYLAEALGVKETIQSPTFVIMKKYGIQKLESGIQGKPFTQTQDSRFELLIHIDAYRLEKSAEMLNLGWSELILDPQNLICIEWPERIAEIMPQHIKISFEHGEVETERKISIA